MIAKVATTHHQIEFTKRSPMPLRPTSWLTSSHRPKNVPNEHQQLRDLEPGEGPRLHGIDPERGRRAEAQRRKLLLVPSHAREVRVRR